ncbi:hypothetical protein BDR26DRAFT_874683 [Obelidium mucronatum]|nr:hypothetical protein BDR26DRAFT_874683 [Obelidium mucronatum]
MEYKPGDEIYAFGFSRGATIVRSLFSFIRYAGIVQPQKFNMDKQSLQKSVSEALKCINHEGDADSGGGEIARFRKTFCHPGTATATTSPTTAPAEMLKFIGVFDTVAALNVPDGYSSLVPSKYLNSVLTALGQIEPNAYHDLTIGPELPYAFQAISIDEKREFFPPVLFEKSVSLKPGLVREQMWFRGSHADVGGGWWETGLSDISLGWMVECARRAGLEVRDLEDFDEAFSPFMIGMDRNYYLGRKKAVLHDYFDKFPSGESPMGRRVPRDLKHYMNEERFGKSALHSSVLTCFKRACFAAELERPRIEIAWFLKGVISRCEVRDQ